MAKQDFKHSQACVQATERVRAWKEEWPLHCEKCGGVGIEETYDYSTGCADVEICLVCFGDAKCPRCGCKHSEDWNAGDEPEPCVNCGWRYDDESTIAPTHSCDCWESIIEQQEDEWWKAQAAEGVDEVIDSILNERFTLSEAKKDGLDGLLAALLIFDADDQEEF